jgi:hypothetical protein
MTSPVPAFLLTALLLLGLTGCETVPPLDGARTGPFFEPRNVRGVVRLPAAVRRIALLPSAGPGGVTEESLAALDTVLATELTRLARAEIIPVSRELMARLFGLRHVDSTGVLPHNLFDQIQRSTEADAILLVDVTALSPYPPLKLGLRAKLFAFGSADLLWAFDDVFDASVPAVQNAARRHYLEGSDYLSMTADRSPSVLQSPSRFSAYAAREMFRSLPPR